MTLATDINTDPSCNWTMDPNMVLARSLGLDDILAMGRRNDHSGGNGSGGPMVAGHKQSLMLLSQL